ncbi:MAG: hypothetical protein AB7G24_07205 [Novosphingobium sp.]
MDHNHVRKGVTNASFNEDNSEILFGQVALLSVACGVYYSSWWVGGGVLFALFIALAIEPLSYLIVFLLSVGWGVAGYLLGVTINASGAPYVLAAIGFLMGLGVNMSGLQWAQDIGD